MDRYQADLLIIMSGPAGAGMGQLPPSEPALHPVIPEEDDPVSRLVWSGSPRAVRSVWVGGRQVVGDGRVLTVDAGEVRAEATERARRPAK